MPRTSAIIMPTAHKKGAKGERLRSLNGRIFKTIKFTTQLAIRDASKTNGSNCQPSHAPMTLSNLKSPADIPSLAAPRILYL